MKVMELIAPCHFGLEAVLKREITDLGYEIKEVEDGRVTFLADAEGLCRANIGLRTAERVLLKVGSFEAATFDELFENTKALPWEDYLPEDARFWVAKAASVKSKLFSPSDIQSIIKKAIVSRLGQIYGISWFTEEGQHEQRSHTANPISGVVDTLLDLADTRAYEEQQRQIRRRKKRKLHR